MRMIKFVSIFKVAVALIAVCGLVFTSCEAFMQEKDGPFEVSVINPSVGAAKGRQFVKVKCTGNWTLELVSDKGDVDWAELDVTSGTGNKSNVRLSYETNTSEESRNLTIFLDDGKKSVFCTLTQLAAGELPEEKPDPVPSGNVDLTKVEWMELPSMDDPNLEYYTHSFVMNGKKYRNYSFGYSKADYLAIWVAYPICDMYISGSADGDGDDWASNPLFSADYQPTFYRSFGYSRGYERGHQIANADRRCCDEANLQTYYYSNATLQHMDFNGAIWARLEGNLRSAASPAPTDTMYVITGCVVPEDPEYIVDYAGHNVPIPTGYFKAALRYAKEDPNGTWLGAAFYLDHKKYSYNNITGKEVMSIDQLEEKLRMNFFVNFEKKYGDAAAKIEAQDPNKYKSVWKIN